MWKKRSRKRDWVRRGYAGCWFLAKELSSCEERLASQLVEYGAAEMDVGF